ncbi:UDP-GlcNAc:betaGal beta-1,3-N-acetylglucosaminyltransferase 7-like [Misgurnus anguillicaudatus]|uniref:UDP-GlcNAc:betaGal beta-1,3-N-acetylglucosaminyltransferase 7-like n=1 Tax=Misgurnus anguillicaudatus TaxID=75329 RepID=UPI003CCF83A6
MMRVKKLLQFFQRTFLLLFLALVMLTIIQIVIQRENIRPLQMRSELRTGEGPNPISVNLWNKSMERPTVPTTWDIISSNCSANPNFTSQEWFTNLESNFQQFMLYRHCRYFPMLINHPEKCAGDIDLLIVIKSVITQHDRREVIRQTWGKEQTVDGKRIKTVFLLGVSSNQEERANHQKLLEYEDQIYGDILQWDFMDSFFNLTLKEIHFLKWFSMYCRNARHIFKGDDDVFVGISNIFEYLEASKNVKDLFVGDVLFSAKPIHNKNSKYFIPQVLYQKKSYPPYASGGGFLMDGPLARKLYKACETVELYPIDDVFLGMCLEVLKVTPIHHNAFKTFGIVSKETSQMNRDPCFYRNLIVVHKLLPPDLINMWKMVNNDSINCSLQNNFLKSQDMFWQKKEYSTKI